MLSILFLSVFSYSECVEILKGISHTVQHEITPMVDALLGRYASLDGRPYVSPFLSPGVPQVKVEPCLDIFAGLKSISADIVSISESCFQLSQRNVTKQAELEQSLSNPNALNKEAIRSTIQNANSVGRQIIEAHKILRRGIESLSTQEANERINFQEEERQARSDLSIQLSLLKLGHTRANPESVSIIQRYMRALISVWEVSKRREAGLDAAVQKYEADRTAGSPVKKRRDFSELSEEDQEEYHYLSVLSNQYKEELEKTKGYDERRMQHVLIASLNDRIEHLLSENGDHPDFVATDENLRDYIDKKIEGIIEALTVHVELQEEFVHKLEQDLEKLKSTNTNGVNDEKIKAKEKDLEGARKELAEMRTDEQANKTKILLLQSDKFREDVRRQTIFDVQRPTSNTDYTSFFGIAVAVVEGTDDRDAQLRRLRYLFDPSRARYLFERLRVQVFLGRIPDLMEGALFLRGSPYAKRLERDMAFYRLFRYCCTADITTGTYQDYKLYTDFEFFVGLRNVTGIEDLRLGREAWINALMLLNIVLDKYKKDEFNSKIKTLYPREFQEFVRDVELLLHFDPLSYGISPGIIESLSDGRLTKYFHPLSRFYDTAAERIQAADLRAASRAPAALLCNAIRQEALTRGMEVFDFAVENATDKAKKSTFGLLRDTNTLGKTESSLALVFHNVTLVDAGKPSFGFIHGANGLSAEKDPKAIRRMVQTTALMIANAWENAQLKPDRIVELLAVIAYRYNNLAAICLNDLYEALVKYYGQHDDLEIPALEEDDLDRLIRELFAEPPPGDEEEGDDSDGDAGGSRVRARRDGGARAGDGARAFGAAAAGAHVELAAV